MILNDTLLATDRGMVTLVVLLDYTAAFDHVDHEIALTILESKFGITASSLSWFESYLSDRTFSVLSSEQQSMRVRLSCSFPQGSTLGPLLYMSLMLLSCKRLQSDMVLGSMALLMIPNLVYQLIRRMLNGPNKL